MLTDANRDTDNNKPSVRGAGIYEWSVISRQKIVDSVITDLDLPPPGIRTQTPADVCPPENKCFQEIKRVPGTGVHNERMGNSVHQKKKNEIKRTLLQQLVNCLKSLKSRKMFTGAINTCRMPQRVELYRQTYTPVQIGPATKGQKQRSFNTKDIVCHFSCTIISM